MPLALRHEEALHGSGPHLVVGAREDGNKGGEGVSLQTKIKVVSVYSLCSDSTLGATCNVGNLLHIPYEANRLWMWHLLRRRLVSMVTQLQTFPVRG